MSDGYRLTVSEIGAAPSSERVARLLAQLFQFATTSTARQALLDLPLTLVTGVDSETAQFLNRHLEARGATVALEGPPMFLNESDSETAFEEAETSLGYQEEEESFSLDAEEFADMDFSFDGDLSAGSDSPSDYSEEEDGGMDEPTGPAPTYSLGGMSISLGDDSDEQVSDDGGTKPEIEHEPPKPAAPNSPESIPMPKDEEYTTAKFENITKVVAAGSKKQRRDVGPRGVAPKSGDAGTWDKKAAKSAAPWEEEKAKKPKLSRLFKGMLGR